MDKLRFTGYTEPWEQQKLGEVLSVPEKEKVSNDEIDIDKLITVKLHMKGVQRNERTATLKVGATNYFIRRVGQFIYGKQNLFNGAMGIIPENLDGYLSSQDIPALDIDYSVTTGAYLMGCMGREAFYKNLVSLSTGTGSKRISEKSLFEVSIPLPSLAEQEKIGGFLSALDERLRVQSELVDLLALEYTGYAQRIFNQTLRFKDENGNQYPDWKQKKLEDLFNHTKTGGITKSHLNPSGWQKCFLYGEMYSDFRTIINSTKSRTDIIRGHITSAPSIVIPASGESGKEIARASVINEDGVLLGGDLNILAPRSSLLDLPFCAYSINHSSINKKMSLMSQGSSIFHLSWRDIKKLEMMVPCQAEQKKIGQFLEKLELRIEAERALLAQYKEQKKAYLQKLLP